MPPNSPSTAIIADTPAHNDTVVAVLGPTNTGKTHYAIERMLGHDSGVMGFPLRLLAREVYDRVVAVRGPSEVALITGEEKIVPPRARYYLCTVESMPLELNPSFLAVDEIQLCADPDRGHVFTHRLLHARGRHETLFLGSTVMWDRIKSLLPGARFLTRERMSVLSYAGSKKIARLPERSAIVAFSAENVYAIAELLRRQKGGAAVVMGALSPRTRNAQVQLYQEGEVNYLVATDAIGMGLNLDVRHVAFAGLSKFDGRHNRHLNAVEIGQIAGRAGRHTNDGTFGTTGEAPPLDDDYVEAVENHQFDPVQKLQWRSSRLDYATPLNLLLSLEAEAPSRELVRARDADDMIALRQMAHDPQIQDRAKGRAMVKLLWDVCQVPDFRKTMTTEHVALLRRIYDFLCGSHRVIPSDWMAEQCARLDRTDGDIDTLSKRLAFIRTWTYVANRNNWLDDPAEWRERTRDIEDKLSDALHACLTQRFVDRRTSVLMRRLKQKESLVASIDETGAVTVEGEFVGKLEGFRFLPDPNAAGAEVKTLQAASTQALQYEISRRVEKFYSATDQQIEMTEQGGLIYDNTAIGRLEATADPFAPKAVAFVDETIEPALRDKIERRLQFWIDNKIKAVFEPLLALKNDEAITGLARGVAFQIAEGFGIVPRQQIAQDIKQLDQESRSLLRKHGVRFGQYTIFMPVLLKPAPTKMRLILWGLSNQLDEIPSCPPPGAVTIPIVPETDPMIMAMSGYRGCGDRALRLDMLERLADMIRPFDVRAGFEASSEMLSITGTTLEQFASLMEGLGFRAEKGEREKVVKPKVEPGAASEDVTAETSPAESASAESAPETAQASSEQETQTPAELPAQDIAAVAEDSIAAPEAAEGPSAQADAMGDQPDAGAASELNAEAGVQEALGEEALQSVEEGQGSTAPALSGEEGSSQETPAGEPSSGEPLSAEPEQPAQEVFYTFRLLPRGRRQRGEGRDDARPARREQRSRGGQASPSQAPQSGEDRAPGRDGGRSQEGGPRRRPNKFDGQPGSKTRGDGHREGGRGQGGRGNGSGGKGDRFKGGKGGANKSREFSSAPSRSSKGPDPDSPFAILQKLKEGK
ncbi:MAG: disulfide oxidoreductase [Neomegalonema sp.]|nr:disulfide oxidoreductase [Neomegalonema sp.]